MNGENLLLLTDELAEMGYNRLKFKTSGKLSIMLEEYREYSSN